MSSSYFNKIKRNLGYFHIMRGEWRLYVDSDTVIDCRHLIDLANSQKRKSKSIWIKDIAIKSLDSIPDNPSEYEYVNPKIPIIVVEGLQNKDNKKYRLLDGRHRILKTLKRDRAAINAHVFSFDEIEPYIEIYRSCINPKCDANPIDLQVICQYCGTRQFSSKKIKPL